MIRAAIFDVDGTLVDSVDLHAEAWQRAFRHFGKEIAFEDVRAQIGKGGDQLMPVFLSKEEIKEFGEELSQWRTKLFAKEYLPRLRGLPKVRELFQELLTHGVQLALASSALGKELQTYKERAQIADLVETETSQDDADKSKPHPDIFEAALEKLGHPPLDQTLVIGDTPYDIEAAQKAGLQTIAVRSGGFPDDMLRGAIAIYDDPADLLAHLAESPLARASGA